MLLHYIVVYLITLPCLSLSSTAPQALHSNAEVTVALGRGTRPPHYGGAAQAVSGPGRGRTEPPTFEKYRSEVSREAITTLQSNTRQGTTNAADGRVRTHSEGRKQEGIYHRVTSNSDTPGWFTDTLNVTVTPKVIWTRRAAPQRPSSSIQEEESTVRGEKRTQHEDEHEEEDIFLTVTFIKEGQPLVLDLHPTRDLLAATYTESSGGKTREDDSFPREAQALPCEYQGVVRGVAEAWAALSVCGGLRGVVSRTLEDGTQVELLVEPSPGSTSSREPHAVFSAALLSLPGGVCGVKDAGTSAEAEGEAEEFHTAQRSPNASLPSSRRARRWAGLAGGPLWYQSSTRFVELVLVADHSFYTKHGDQTLSRCKTIVNIVNAVYRPLGVVVVLSHLEVWKHGDKMAVTADYEVNLDRLKEHRKKMLKENPDYNNDNTMLLTTVDFRDTTVGYAVVSGMCSASASAGVVQDKNRHAGVTAYTVAHEMGHNFGMNHDEKHCQCSSSACIMSGTGSTKFNHRISWSSCSRQVVDNKRDSVNYACLRNVPTRMYSRASCGDGVVDDGEQCDCGPAEFCNNPCCDASTCRFAVNASCASGPCCDTKTCQPKPSGTECRAAFTECDLPEFCSGDSESCPEDVTKLDGAPCRGGQGLCYEAKCGSHAGQCQGVWGSSATVADQQCYLNLNIKGSGTGNCGYKGHSKTELLPCADGDELCGSLQCVPEPDTEPSQLGGGFKYGTISYSRFSCSHIISSDNIPTSHWLTPDGAKCGENKMCVNQKCVRIPEPAGHCRGGCSGRGVCNSRNHCHCEPGFAPPDCSKAGSGGSIDSNRIGRDRYKDPLWETLFILSLILLGVAIAICCLWSHIRRWWEAGGRGKTCPCCALCLDVCCCFLMSLVTDRLCTKAGQVASNEAQDKYERDRFTCVAEPDLEDPADYKGKILLPPNHSAHPSTRDAPSRPTYSQSVSVDSGCVSDAEDTVVRQPFLSQMSMKSLVSVFKNFGSRSSSSSAEDEKALHRTYERQHSMPLSRFVVDPLSGSRRSRHGTPPVNPEKPKWCRSVSVEAHTNPSGRPKGTPPPPPPPTAKPSKGATNLTQTCASTEPQGVAMPRVIHPVSMSIPGGKKPMRPAPVRPPPAVPASTPPPPSGARKPLMPPNKTTLTPIIRKTCSQSSNESSLTSNTSSRAAQGKVNGPPKRPVLPPGRGSPKPPRTTPCGPSKQPLDEGARPYTANARVRDLVKQLEKQ